MKGKGEEGKGAAISSREMTETRSNQSNQIAEFSLIKVCV